MMSSALKATVRWPHCSGAIACQMAGSGDSPAGGPGATVTCAKTHGARSLTRSSGVNGPRGEPSARPAVPGPLQGRRLLRALHCRRGHVRRTSVRCDQVPGARARGQRDTARGAHKEPAAAWVRVHGGAAGCCIPPCAAHACVAVGIAARLQREGATSRKHVLAL
jgi:hypothetical protein